MAEFLMPSLGADMTSGTLRKWLVRPGDTVAKGEVVAEVETDKGLAEVESFEAGVVERLLVEPGATVPVGTPLATLRLEGEAPRAPPPTAAAPRPSRVLASPLARRRAQELGVDLANLVGTGPGGAVSVADVERAILPGGPPPRAPPAPPVAPKAPPLDRAAAARRAMGAAMSRAKREIPHYYVRTTVDLKPALDWLSARNAARPASERLLPAVLFVRAVALAAREFPDFNAHWIDGEPRPLDRVHVGVAVALRGGGLVAPAIHDTDRLALDELRRAFESVVQRARAGVQRASEMVDGTITVTSLGERGVETVFPIIIPPQVAIVGTGRIVERAWVVDGRVVPRPVVDVTLAADHRASEGRRGASFLARIAALIAAPEDA